VVAQQHAAVSAAAKAAGRPVPRLSAARYFVLGDDARARAEANVRAYYGIGGDALVQGVLSALLTQPEQVRAAVRELTAVGVDETFFWTTSPDLDQIDRLAKVVF
jgi:hypothetical protein